MIMQDKDSFLIAKAIIQRWPISSEYREAIVRRLIKIIVDKESSNREVTTAAKALMSAEAQNQSDEHTAAVQSDRNRFLEVARQLGIEADFRLVTEERADSSDGGSDGAERPEPDSGQGYRAETFDEKQGS